VVIARALVYAVIFVGIVLVFVPARFLSWSGFAAPATFGALQLVGMLVAVAGLALAAWCVLAFAVIGKGTPAPFDPPRMLVVRGPYRLVRNPMYIGGGLALVGAAVFYESGRLLIYAGLFFLAAHLFVIGYEEPTLRRMFGADYEAYCRHVRRWWPSASARQPP
jgi:protein-S-isoprenylcysteine O-methyltransferase Ste14